MVPRITHPYCVYMFMLFLLQLSKMTKLKDAIRNDLLPTADMVVSMSREFGVPLTTEDFEGFQFMNFTKETLLDNLSSL